LTEEGKQLETVLSPWNFEQAMKIPSERERFSQLLDQAIANLS